MNPEQAKALTDKQLNVKIAKLRGWKTDGKTWWHDDLGDGPPPNYAAAGRQLDFTPLKMAIAGRNFLKAFQDKLNGSTPESWSAVFNRKESQ